jgi:hypothetical protein
MLKFQKKIPYMPCTLMMQFLKLNCLIFFLIYCAFWAAFSRGWQHDKETEKAADDKTTCCYLHPKPKSML